MIFDVECIAKHGFDPGLSESWNTNQGNKGNFSTSHSFTRTQGTVI